MAMSKAGLVTCNCCVRVPSLSHRLIVLFMVPAHIAAGATRLERDGMHVHRVADLDQNVPEHVCHGYAAVASGRAVDPNNGLDVRRKPAGDIAPAN